MTFVLFSLRRAWQGFWRNGLMSIAATFTMVLMLILLAGFFVLQSALLASLTFVEQKVEVMADLYDNTTETQLADLIARTEALPQVTEVRYVSRDEALRRFRETRAAQGEEDLTRYLEGNPLHASLEIALTDPREFSVVAEALRAEPVVERVKNIRDLGDRVTTVTTIVRNGGIVVLAVVGLIVLFIIVNTIRLAVVARSEEIEIMRLVGASDAFIRWPFVFEGALVGLIGAAIALAILGVSAEPVAAFMTGFFNVLPLTFGALARDTAAIVLATGLGLGILGSWVSVRTYLIR